MVPVATTELGVSLEPDLLARLEAAARHVGMSRSEMLNHLVQWALHEDELEDVLDAIIGERAYYDPENQERIPWERAKAELREAPDK